MIRKSLFLLALAGLAMVYPPWTAATEGDSLPNTPEIWSDPTFRAQFLGSYGFNSEIEPAVDLDEQPLLLEIQAYFPDDLDGAEERLLAITTAGTADDGERKKKKRKDRRNNKKKQAESETESEETDKAADGQAERPAQELEVDAEPVAVPGSGVSAVFDYLLGNVYYQKRLSGAEDDEGLLNKAIPCYKRAIEKFPSYRRAHKNLGLIYVQQGNYAEAIDPLSRVIQLGGGDGLTYGLLGYAYVANSQYLSAESAFRSALLLQPDAIDWKVGLTQAVLRQKKYDEAVALCEELITLNPERSEYWLLQANAFIGQNEPLKAAENYELLHRMGKTSVQTLHTLGDIYVNEELWDLAERAYLKAVEAKPEQAVGRPLRNVEVLAQRGALQQAKTLLSATKRFLGERLDDGQRKKLLKLEARITVADGAGSAAAVDVLEEIVALDPLDGEALILLGQHYVRTDDPERAIFFYERAESIDDFAADAKVRHAEALVNQSKYDEAIPLLKQAQEAKPRDDVARYLEQVERFARSRR